MAKRLAGQPFCQIYSVLKKGGIVFLTTRGNNFKVKLSHSELQRFEKGKLIERGEVKEGHRTYTAFQPDAFMRTLFSNVEVLEHIEMPPELGRWLPQDIWIVKK